MSEAREINLAALPRSLAHLASVKSAAERVQSSASRDGSPNLVVRDGQRAIWLHSRYDPRREAERLAAGVRSESVVVLGFGVGYHIEELARRSLRVVVVEPDVELFAAALACRPMESLFKSDSICWCVGGDLAHTERSVLDCYLPALDGSLSVVNLPGRTSADLREFEGVRAAVARATERVKDDLATQARFARAWTRNTLLNVASLHQFRRNPVPRLPDWSDRPAIVVAAGPSLADQIDRVASRAGSHRVVATDTAAPLLLASGIRPDAVVSVDCQLATYQHYRKPQSSDLDVYGELAMYPPLARMLPNLVPVASAHPLNNLLRMVGLRLTPIDASGGSVTHAAFSLACAMKAQRIVLAGTDFSYPHGETYPRGTYVDTLFSVAATRLDPLSARHAGFLFDRPGLVVDEAAPGRYLQPVLTRYRQTLERMARETAIPVEQLPGAGVPLDLPAATPPSCSGGDALMGGQTPLLAKQRSPRDVLGQIRDIVEPVDSSARMRREARGSNALRSQAVLSLLPLAVQHQIVDAMAVDDALAAARNDTLSLLDTALTLCRNDT